jgi:hypothetical protein
MTRRITNAIGRHTLTTALRGSWAILRFGERLSRLGARLEAVVVEVAQRTGIDEMDVIRPLVPHGDRP